MTMKTIIYKKLTNKFKPEVLKVENESHRHVNHAQSPKGGNSHFSVVIKSDIFNNVSRVEAQRMIYKVLDEEFKKSLHALRIKIINQNNQ